MTPIDSTKWGRRKSRDVRQKHTAYGDLAFKWVATAVGVYAVALLLGQEINPVVYFGAFVGVPFATFYGGVAYYRVKRLWKER